MIIDSWVPAIAVIDETVKWKGGRIMRDNKRGEAKWMSAVNLGSAVLVLDKNSFYVLGCGFPSARDLRL